MIIKKNENSYRFENTDETTGFTAKTETQVYDVPATKDGEVWAGEINNLPDELKEVVAYYNYPVEVVE